MKAIGIINVVPAETVTWTLSRTDALLLQCALTDSVSFNVDLAREHKDPAFTEVADISRRLREQLVELRRAAGHPVTPS